MEAKQRRGWPRPRFTLAVLLVVVTVAAIPLSYVAQRRAWNLRRKAATELLSGKGVHLSSDVIVDDKVNTAAKPRASLLAAFWRRLLGDDLAPTLRSFEYSPTPNQAKKLAPLTDSDLALLKLFPETESVSLGSADQVTDFGIAIVCGLPDLQHLQLHYLPQPKGLFLESLHAKSSIKRMQFTKLDALEGENLTPINRLPLLERFWVDRCAKLDDGSLMHVTMPLTVDNLMINQCPIGDSTILRWLVNHHYRHLSICGKMTQISLNSLAQQTEVEQLYLKTAPLVDADFAFLKHWKKLDVLHLEAMPVTGEFLDEIAASETVLSIKVTSTLFKDANIAKLSRFSKASTIDLSFTPITGEGFREFPKLQDHCQLRLIGTRFTDEGMDALAKMRSISGQASPFMKISLPSNWTAEDYRRFEGGKAPWNVEADIFTALERRKQGDNDTQFYWSGFESRTSTPLNNIPAHLMRPVLSLHEDAREKSHQEEDAATKAYIEAGKR